MTASTGGAVVASNVFRLPADMLPQRELTFPVAVGPANGNTGTDAAELVISPAGPNAGFVRVLQAGDSTDPVVHLGEIIFRADA